MHTAFLVLHMISSLWQCISKMFSRCLVALSSIKTVLKATDSIVILFFASLYV